MGFSALKYLKSLQRVILDKPLYMRESSTVRGPVGLTRLPCWKSDLARKVSLLEYNGITQCDLVVHDSAHKISQLDLYEAVFAYSLISDVSPLLMRIASVVSLDLSFNQVSFHSLAGRRIYHAF